MLLKTFFREFSLQQEILEMWASTIETHFLRSKFNIFFRKADLLNIVSTLLCVAYALT